MTRILWRVHRNLPDRRQRCATVLLLVLFLFLPALVPAQPDRSHPPALGSPPRLTLPALQHLTLSNGVPVLLLEKHTVPLVQINLIVRAGSLMDPPGKQGLADMTASMLMEGAGHRTSLELADAIDFLGVQISSESGRHTMGVNLHTPLSKLDSAIVLMADIVCRPTFPPEDLERLRKERLTEMMQGRDDPDYIASVAFGHALYGAHSYGVPKLGTDQGVRAVTTADVLTFHRKYIVPANATIIVVGDVTPVTILPRLERAFGSWKGSGAIPPPVPPIVPTAGRTLILIDKPGAEQSVIRIGRVAAPRLTDDYDAMTVMNTILGGSFTSRLNQNLRERHGYTYGASSGFDFRPLAGPFIASSSVQTAVTDKALGEFLKEFQRMLVMVPDSDLVRAKNYMAFRFPGGFETVSQIANRLEELVIYGLPDDYFDGAIDRILAVTKGDVLRAAEKYIRMENLAFVIVGDLATIADSVKSLDIAPASVLTVDDALGPLQHRAPGE